MLKFFNRLERTRNFVLLLFAVLMVLSLVLFYAPTPDNQQANSTRSTETVAKVGGETVTLGEVSTFSQINNGATSPARILDQLIPARIVRQEAERLNLTASDAEVAEMIRRENKPTDGTAFNQKVYEQNAVEKLGSIKNYEQAVRDQLSGQKLEAFITSGVTVSEEDVLSDFKRGNAKFDLSFVPVGTANVAQNLKFSDEELKNYFEQNKKNYYISLPQKKIRYVFLDTAKIGEKLTIPSTELQAEYDKLSDDRKQAGVQGQQIVLRVANPELDSQVLAKADEMVEKARKEDGKISEEAFGELAKGQSEDPRTAPAAGKIPGLVKPNLNPAPDTPPDPYQQLLTMQEGEVSDPINYKGNYYILRRGASVPKSFEDARKEIEVSLRNRRAYAVAAELAQKVADDLKQTKDAQKTAATFAVQASSNVSEMVRETPFVKQGDEVPDVGISPQFESGIEPLENAGDVGDKIPIKGGFAIPVLVEKREPHEATFEEVRDQAEQAFRVEQARGRVEQTAKEIAAEATSAGNLASVAQSKGLKAEDSKNFILGSPLGQGASAATSTALEDAIYNLKTGEVTKTPIKVGDSWYIVGVSNRTEANMDDFAKQRDQMVEGMLSQKRGQVFSDYLAEIRRRFEEDGQIKIYKDVLEKIKSADETTDEG